MKKYFYVFLALICTTAIFSCKKALELTETAEKVQAENAGNVVTIHAGFSEETKTSYAGEVTFSWTIGDKIGVWTTNDTDYEKVIFTAQATGPSVDFTGTLSDGYHLVANGKAFYPDGDAVARNNFVSTFDGTDYTVTLGGTVDVDLENPMAIIPLVGNNDGTGNYSFKTATGILKVTFENLQAATSYVTVFYEDGSTALNGTYTLENDEVKLANATKPYLLKYLKVNNISEGSTGVFYFPLPTGTLPENLWFSTLNSAYGYLTYKKATKVIPITRNRITNISVTIDGGSEWEYLGVGYYLDNYLFGEIGGSKQGYYVPVDIQRKKSNTNHFRVSRPYQTAWAEFGVTEGSNLSNYITLEVKRGEDMELGITGHRVTVTNENLVFFYGEDNASNAVGAATSEHNSRLIHPNWTGEDSESYYLNSKVVSYQDDGVTPKLIQLAPEFDLEGTSGTRKWFDDKNDAVYIVFPGCNPALAVIGNYNIDGNNKFTLKIEESDDITKGNIMITKYTNTNSNFNDGYGNSVNHVDGRLYGMFADGKMVFPRGQKFADYNTTNNTFWTIFEGTSGAHNETITFTLQFKNNADMGKVFTRSRIGLSFGTESALLSGTETESNQYFSSGDGKYIKKY